MPDTRSIFSLFSDPSIIELYPLSLHDALPIYSDWRNEIEKEVEARDLPVDLYAPVTDHAASDDVGIAILGDEEKDVWKDSKGAKINAIRTRTLIEQADIVVVRFGDKY